MNISWFIYVYHYNFYAPCISCTIKVAVSVPADASEFANIPLVRSALDLNHGRINMVEDTGTAQKVEICVFDKRVTSEFM